MFAFAGYIIHITLALLEALLVLCLFVLGMVALARKMFMSRSILSSGRSSINALIPEMLPGFGQILLAIFLGLAAVGLLPFPVTAAAALIAGGYLAFQQRQARPFRWNGGAVARTLLVGAAALTATYAVYERADPIALGYRLGVKAYTYQQSEARWHRVHELHAPNVGDVAPDFELQDPHGATTVRLSAFRGNRPVLLTFGAHT